MPALRLVAGGIRLQALQGTRANKCMEGSKKTALSEPWEKSKLICIRVISVLRIRHQGDSLVGEVGVACHRGARGTSDMIFAQLAGKEWEQVVNTSHRKRAAAWQRRSSKATIVQ